MARVENIDRENTHSLISAAKAMVPKGARSVSAMDESTGSCNKRFVSVGIPLAKGNR